MVVDFDKSSSHRLKIEIDRFYKHLLASPIIKESEEKIGHPIPPVPPLGSKIGPTYKLEQPNFPDSPPLQPPLFSFSSLHPTHPFPFPFLHPFSMGYD